MWIASPMLDQCPRLMPGILRIAAAILIGLVGATTTASAQTPPSTDRLDAVVDKDGAVTLGRVEALSDGTLRLRDPSGAIVARSRQELALINFAIGQKGRAPDPPETAQQGTDLVVTYDGRALITRVQSISNDAVVTVAQTLPRGSVDLVVFGRGGSEVNTSTPPPPPPPPPEIANLCPPDKPLGARLEWSHEAQEDNSCPRTVHATARLEFDVIPALPDIKELGASGSAQALAAYTVSATQISIEETASECEGRLSQETICAAPEAEFSATQQPSVARYQPFLPYLQVVPRYEVRPDVKTCVSPNSVLKFPEGVPRAAGFAAYHSFKGQYFANASAPPGPCWKNGALSATDECRQHPQRFMVLPFNGRHEGGAFGSLKWIRHEWHVCCGCGEAEEAEVSEEGDEDCLSALKALAQYWYVELRLRFGALKAAYEDMPELADLAPADTPENREAYTEVFTAGDSLFAGIEERRRELMEAYRHCIQCAEEQGLDPSLCPRPEPGWPEHPDL